jgi:hypothetical protein
MKSFLASGLCLFLLLLAAPTYAGAADKVIVEVNVMGVDQIGDAQQGALAQQLQDNGVQTIRTSRGGHGDRDTSFLIKAYRHGIGSVVLVSPFANNTAKHALAPDLAKLDAAGVRIVAFEAGNEINSSPFNADFAPPGPGRPLELADLNNPADPQGRAVALATGLI